MQNCYPSNYEIRHFPPKYRTQPLYYICSFSRSPETLLLLVLRALIFPPRWLLPSVEILRMLPIVVNLCSKTTRMSHFQLSNWENQFRVDLTFSLEGLLSKTQHTYLKCPFTFWRCSSDPRINFPCGFPFMTNG